MNNKVWIAVSFTLLTQVANAQTDRQSQAAEPKKSTDKNTGLNLSEKPAFPKALPCYVKKE